MGCGSLNLDLLCRHEDFGQRSCSSNPRTLLRVLLRARGRLSEEEDFQSTQPPHLGRLFYGQSSAGHGETNAIFTHHSRFV